MKFYSDFIYSDSLKWYLAILISLPLLRAGNFVLFEYNLD